MRLGKTENEEIHDTKARPRGPKIARKDLKPNWQLRDGLNPKSVPVAIPLKRKSATTACDDWPTPRDVRVRFFSSFGVRLKCAPQ